MDAVTIARLPAQRFHMPASRREARTTAQRFNAGNDGDAGRTSSRRDRMNFVPRAQCERRTPAHASPPGRPGCVRGLPSVETLGYSRLVPPGQAQSKHPSRASKKPVAIHRSESFRLGSCGSRTCRAENRAGVARGRLGMADSGGGIRGSGLGTGRSRLGMDDPFQGMDEFPARNESSIPGNERSIPRRERLPEGRDRRWTPGSSTAEGRWSSTADERGWTPMREGSGGF